MRYSPSQEGVMSSRLSSISRVRLLFFYVCLFGGVFVWGGAGSEDLTFRMFAAQPDSFYKSTLCC